MRYLLDSDIVINYQRRRPRAESFVEMLAEGDGELCTCSVVLAEVHSGLALEQRQAIHHFLEGLTFLPTSAQAGEQAGVWRHQFARQGIILQVADMLIAATALEHDVILVTGNLKDFPMDGLTIVPYPRES